MSDRLHVCHLGKYYPPAPGGIETHVQTLARAQAEAGADVRVLCVNHAGRTGRNVTWDRYGATSTVEDHDGAVRVTRLGRSATLARLDICRDLPSAINDLFKHPLDVLHLHTPNPTMTLAITRLRKTVPIVVTHHSDVVKQRLLRHVLGPFERVVYNRAASLLATSEAYIEGSPLLSKFRSKVEVVPMGIDLHDLLRPSSEALVHQRRWKDQLGEVIWLAVGRCVYYKGFETAIAALPDVPGKLLIIGAGPTEPLLRQQADKLGVADRVVWCSFASRDQLIGAYLAATALWFPSTHRSEAFGLVQVEAMASGLPVLNTQIPASGVSWVSRHEESGLTIPMNDPAALAAASRRLLNEPGLRDRLAAGAVARAKSEFDHRLMAERTLQLYERIRRDRTIRPTVVVSRFVRQQDRAVRFGT